MTPFRPIGYGCVRLHGGLVRQVFDLAQGGVYIGQDHRHGATFFFGEMLPGAENNVQAVVAATLIGDAMHGS